MSDEEPEDEVGEEGVESEEGYESELGEDEGEEDEEVEFNLLPEHIETIQTSLGWVVEAVGSAHEVGIAIYTAIMAEVSPEDKVLFKAPLNLQALQFITQVARIIEALDHPNDLHEEIYNMSIRHIAYCKPIHIKRYLPAFAAAVLGTLKAVLDDSWSELGEESWTLMLTYVGRSLLKLLTEFSGKVFIVQRSWHQIYETAMTTALVREEADAQNAGEPDADQAEEDRKRREARRAAKAAKKTGDAPKGGLLARLCGKGVEDEAHQKKKAGGNEAVAGFGDSLYFNLGVMAQEISSGFMSPRATLSVAFETGFRKMVELIVDPAALQEFLYVLAIKHLKYGDVKTELFPVFGQAVMVTARSMLPRAWDYKHEEAWSWLWDTLAQMLGSNLANAARYKQLVDDSLDRLADVNMEELSLKFYDKLFSISAEVMQWFYKPQAIVYFIVERVFGLLGALSHEPERIASEVRSLGMRHIKYNIPSSLFPTFGDAILDVLSLYLEGSWTDECEAAWSSVFNFTCKTMTRAVTMGTNLVTRAVVANSPTILDDALRVAPRSGRARWVLEIDVLGARLSPLLWALESGKLNMAGLMLDDVLAIRADRQEYYFGKDDLFQTHPDIVGQLLILAPSLVTRLLDGLVWQSRLSEKGQLRRVNFYVERMYGDPRDASMVDVYKTPMADFVRLASPSMFTHPVLSVLLDLKWTGFASRVHMRTQSVYVFILALFITAYVIVPVEYMHEDDPKKDPNFTAVLALRSILAGVNILALAFLQLTRIVSEVRAGQTVRVLRGKLRLPKSVTKGAFLCRVVASVTLTASLAMDPYVNDPPGVGLMSHASQEGYRWCVACSALLMFVLLTDVFEAWPRAVLLRYQVANVMQDFLPLLVTVLIFVLGTSCALYVAEMSSVGYDHTKSGTHQGFDGMMLSMLLHLLGNASFNVATSTMYQFFYVVSMFLMVFFCGASVIALYVSRLYNMEAEGHTARQRALTVLDTESYTSLRQRRTAFERLRFDEKIEFDEGDLGPSGGVQLMQPTSKFEAIDRIQRYPGECSPNLAWPTVKTTGFDLAEVIDQNLEIARRMYKQAREFVKSKGLAGTSSMGSSSMGLSSTGGSSTSSHEG